MGYKGTVPSVPATPMTPAWSLSLVLGDSGGWCCGLYIKCPQEAHVFEHSVPIYYCYLEIKGCELPGGGACAGQSESLGVRFEVL